MPTIFREPDECWVLDLDGVVWLGATPIPGSVEAITSLRAAGHRVGFCSNNSGPTTAQYLAKLNGLGIAASADDVVSSATAVATMVSPGERVLVVAGAGVREAVIASGAEAVDPRIDLSGSGSFAGFDAVVVGFHPDFDYQVMTAALRAVDHGARLLAANTDPIYPTDSGPSPGCGAILASIEVATGQRAIVGGKPHQPMVDIVHARWGATGIMVGDSPTTDGALADALGWPFGLVLTGNTSRAVADHAVGSRPDGGPPWQIAERLEFLVGASAPSANPSDSS